MYAQLSNFPMECFRVYKNFFFGFFFCFLIFFRNRLSNSSTSSTPSMKSSSVSFVSFNRIPRAFEFQVKESNCRNRVRIIQTTCLFPLEILTGKLASRSRTTLYSCTFCFNLSVTTRLYPFLKSITFVYSNQGILQLQTANKP